LYAVAPPLSAGRPHGTKPTTSRRTGYAPGKKSIGTSRRGTAARCTIAPFRDVFQRIAAHPITQLADLLPDKWLAARSTAA